MTNGDNWRTVSPLVACVFVLIAVPLRPPVHRNRGFFYARTMRLVSDGSSAERSSSMAWASGRVTGGIAHGIHWADHGDQNWMR